MNIKLDKNQQLAIQQKLKHEIEAIDLNEADLRNLNGGFKKTRELATTQESAEESLATTWAIGEEGMYTTMAIGEEGGTATTMAIGEEGCIYPPLK